MGLADRDYMRDRERDRASARGAILQDGPGRFRRPRTLRTGTTIRKAAGVVALLALVAWGLWLQASRPPPATMGAVEITTTTDDAQPMDETPPSPSVTDGVRFPASGTIEWGGAGRPIGGELGQLQIWDVTGSPQNKVVRVRSGPSTIFATVYLAAGQRLALPVPASRTYQVTATSGDNWHGPDAGFGEGGTTVDFGLVNVLNDNPGIVAMGAPDQTASIVRNDRF